MRSPFDDSWPKRLIESCIVDITDQVAELLTVGLWHGRLRRQLPTHFRLHVQMSSKASPALQVGPGRILRETARSTMTSQSRLHSSPGARGQFKYRIPTM